ncbi:choice-of-anchor D domain-containing protein [Roseiflexus sp.]|uniref:choice-of-anchor D domain-containing protein n=1 Tax=Roseiflexus sp. TaxID=2562120 RepID=UPI00398B82DA
MRLSRTSFSFTALFALVLFTSVWLTPVPSIQAATFSIPCGDVSALISAITIANSNNQPDTINLAANCTYTLIGVDNTDDGPTGLPVIRVDGASANSITINGNGATIERSGSAPSFRLFYLDGTLSDFINLTINDLTLRNGRIEDPYDGGAIHARYARLSLNRVVLENNSATEGGALYTLNFDGTITDSFFRDNRSSAGGGAIAFRADGGGQALITGSTFSGNRAEEDGGAIAAYHEVTIRNSTFSGNRTTGGYGGAVWSDSDLEVAYTTVTGTETASDGALYGSIVLRSSLVADNTDTSPGAGNYPDLAGFITSEGYNLIGNVGDYNFDTNTIGDVYGDPLGTTTPNMGATESSTPINPLLAPLADNGGPTPTHALLFGSLALDRIPASINGCGDTVTVDQRRVARPQPTGGNCDTGAFEGTPVPEITVYDGPDTSAPPVSDGQPTVIEFGSTTVGTPLTRVFTIRNAGTAPLSLGALTLPAGFSIVGSFPTGPVAPGATVTFTVQLTATAPGTFSGQLSFANNDADENPFNFPIRGVVNSLPPSVQPIYLPLISRPGQPDLIIERIDIIPDQSSFTAGQPVEIQVVVRNIGTAPAGPFWVDLYINPDRPPQINDLWHDRCTLTPCFGVAWGVTRILQPGEHITLTTAEGYDRLRTYWLGWLAHGTTTVYALADSWNTVGLTGAVTESDEANNQAVRGDLTVRGVNPPAPPWTPASLTASVQSSSSTSLPERPLYAKGGER